MVTECKRIRTRKGDPMMFATLDDLEGSGRDAGVQLRVRGQRREGRRPTAWCSSAGRVDHKEAGEVKLIAQEVEPFEPSAEEVAARPRPSRRRSRRSSGCRWMSRRACPRSFLEELKEVVKGFPGDYELVLRVGDRSLLLGPEYRVSADTACRAELSALPGASVLAA